MRRTRPQRDGLRRDRDRRRAGRLHRRDADRAGGAVACCSSTGRRFPRFRIGESLMPATYWTLSVSACWTKMERHRGSTASSSSRRAASAGSPFYFTEFDDPRRARDLAGGPLSSSTRCCWTTPPSTASRSASRPTSGRCCSRATGASASRRVRRRFAPQTSAPRCGRRQRPDRPDLAPQARAARVDPKLRHAAFFTRYSGAWRGEGMDEGATLIMQTSETGSLVLVHPAA